MHGNGTFVVDSNMAKSDKRNGLLENSTADPHSQNLDEAQIEAKISENILAIIHFMYS